MLVRDMMGEAAEHLHDQNMEKVDADRLFAFLNSASMDARNEGWYVIAPEDDSIVLQNDVWDYAIPSTFVYISRLWLEDPQTPSLFDIVVPLHHWGIALPDDPGDAPVIRFVSIFFAIQEGLHLRIIGQKRPSTYTDFTQQIDGGMESFLRERTISYAARFLAGAGDQLDPRYDKLADQSFAISERMLHSHPQRMRQKPNAQYVPTR
jgi:hypothetical protein